MRSNPAKVREFTAQALPQLEGIYRAATYVLGNERDAQDLVQECFIKAYRSWHNCQFSADSRAWLFKIMANAYVNKYRPFPSLSAAINSADSVEGELVSSQSASPLASGDSVQELYASECISANGRSDVRHGYCRLSTQQRGDDLEQNSSLSLSAAINSAFVADGYWSLSDPQVTEASRQNLSYELQDGQGNGDKESGNHKSSRPVQQRTEDAFVSIPLSSISSDQIKRAIRALPDDIRLITVLSLLEDFSYSEIADIVGVHLETVRSRLPQGRKLIRESFQLRGTSTVLREDHRQSQE